MNGAGKGSVAATSASVCCQPDGGILVMHQSEVYHEGGFVCLSEERDSCAGVALGHRTSSRR